MIQGGTFPRTAIGKGLGSLVAGLNARHPGYRWQLDSPGDDERSLLDRETTPPDQDCLDRPAKEVA